jgi:hypothetical protein
MASDNWISSVIHSMDYASDRNSLLAAWWTVPLAMATGGLVGIYTDPWWAMGIGFGMCLIAPYAYHAGTQLWAMKWRRRIPPSEGYSGKG